MSVNLQVVFDDVFKGLNDKHFRISDVVLKGGCGSHDEYTKACGQLSAYVDSSKEVMDVLRKHGLVSDAPTSTAGNIQEADINPNPESEQTVIEPDAPAVN